MCIKNNACITDIIYIRINNLLPRIDILHQISLNSVKITYKCFKYSFTRNQVIPDLSLGNFILIAPLFLRVNWIINYVAKKSGQNQNLMYHTDAITIKRDKLNVQFRLSISHEDCFSVNQTTTIISNGNNGFTCTRFRMAYVLSNH